MRAHRLLAILTVLLNRGSATAAELAGRFEVSTRTIYRDVEALAEANVPVGTTKGKGGGIYLMEGYSLERSLLSESDRQGLWVALTSLRAARQPGIDDVIEKLSALLRPSQMVDWLHVDFTPWGMKEQDEKFALLREAILKQQRVTFEYVTAVGDKQARRVEPVRLWLKSGAWYLVAWDCLREDFRTFRFSRMRSVVSLPESFSIRRDVPPPSDRWGTPGEIMCLTLCFAACCETRLLDDFPEEMIQRNADGSFTVRARYPKEDWVYDHLLSFGANLVVESPEEVRELLLQRIDRMREFYHAPDK